MKKFISLFYALVLFAGLTTVAKGADPIRIPVGNCQVEWLQLTL